ncbi:diguanylate cyclase domain-containing protein [Gallaecimonas sp. GXIMD1310]|uniref:diguanylate cyclase domain-containing protein n=1 Tax=Gallaecimonas sp. GXIMD1310 TaxID=3131926 RepID=UPI00324B4080
MMIKNNTLWLPVSLVFVLVMFTTQYVAHLQHQSNTEAQRAKDMASLTELRARLESKLNSTLYLGQGLASFLRTHPDASAQQIKAVLADIFTSAKYLRDMVVAPDLVMRYVYPLKGNEGVLNVDYRTLPKQWPLVEYSIRQKKTILDGPVRLIQGGNGLVARTPIFVDGKLWGLSAVVINIDDVMRATGVRQLTSRFSLQITNPSKADSLIFGAHYLPDPTFQLPISVLNDHWQLRATPLSQHWDDGLVLHGVAIALSVLLTLLTFLLLREHQLAKFLANHDPLTSLANRRQFMKALEEAVRQWQLKRRPFALFYIDLNEFKNVNDNYGHAAGDAVLLETAQRLRQVARRSDLVARIGGDEFVLLLPDMGGDKQIQRIVERYLETLQRPIQVGEHSLNIKVALGQARPSENTRNADDLIRKADMAMYQQKPYATS